MGTCEGRSASRGAKLRVTDIWTVKAQWPGKILVKVCRDKLWAWMWTQNSGFTFLQAYSCGTNYESFRVLNWVPNIFSISIMKNIKSYHRYVVTWNISTWQDSCWYLVKWTLTNKRQWNLCEDSLALLFYNSNMIMNMCFQYGNNR